MFHESISNLDHVLHENPVTSHPLIVVQGIMLDIYRKYLLVYWMILVENVIYL